MNRSAFVSRVASVMMKEIRHIRRDPFTLILALELPIMMVVFFGYVISFDVNHIRISVADRDHTRESRQLVDILRGSGYFTPLPVRASPVKDVDSEYARAALVIEPKFGYDVKAGKSPRAQLLLDGSDDQSAGVISSYIAGILPYAWMRLRGKADPAPPPAIQVSTRYLFNPSLNSRWFVVPGLMVVVLGLLCILLTAMTVAREWESGSMELLLTTPVKPLEIMVGKLLPYLGMSFLSALFIYASARVLFGVPFRGDFALLLVACLLFIGICLSIGLVISVTTRQQQAAMQFSMMIGMLPNLLLSGFIFPLESMPRFFYYLTALVPGRWFLVICRALFLKGTDIRNLALPFAALAVMNVVFLSLAVRKFKSDLEP